MSTSQSSTYSAWIPDVRALEDRAVTLLRAAFSRGLPVVFLAILGAHLVFADVGFSVTARALTAIPAWVLAGALARYLRQSDRPRLPFVTVAAFQYYAAFGFPIFFNLSFGDLSGPVTFTRAIEDRTALAVAVGALALAGGAALGGLIGRALEAPFLRILPPDVLPPAFGKIALRWALISLFGAAAFNSWDFPVPGPIRYPAVLILSVPMAMGVIFVIPSRPDGSRPHAKWLAVALGVAAFNSMVLGMIEGSIRAAIAWVAGSLALWRRINVGLVLAFVLAYLAVSPVKHEYRRLAWRQEQDFSVVQRAEKWREAASAVTSGTNVAEEQGTPMGVARLAEFNSVSHAMELVPNVIDYEYGAPWLSIFTAPIPRLIWADKPTTQDLDQRYGVAFLRQTEELAKTTAILQPLLVDGYWNFGWIGLVVAPVLVGLWYGVAAEILRGPHWACSVLGVSMLALNTAHGGLTMLYNGLVQQLVVHLAVVWGLYVVARRSRARPS